MKRGDRVYVNWPTGRGGPYIIEDKVREYDTGVDIEIGSLSVTVPLLWCQPVKPEIKEGDRVYVQWPQLGGPYDVRYSDREHRTAARDGYIPVRVPVSSGGSYYFEVPKQICEVVKHDT